jgi:hypothetical protein
MSWGKKLGGKKPSRIVVRLEMEIENPLGVCLCWSWSVERTIELSPAAREKQNTRTRQNRETRSCAAEGGSVFLACFPFVLATNTGGRTTLTMQHARHELLACRATWPVTWAPKTHSTNWLQNMRTARTSPGRAQTRHHTLNVCNTWQS